MAHELMPYIKGANLCESFFNEIACPILEEEFPGLKYSAGLIGWGSDVLGYDDAMSTDYMWGPRFQLFLTQADFHKSKQHIASVFANHFPYQYKGYSTHFGNPDPNDNRTCLRENVTTGSVHPLVDYHTLETYFIDTLGWDPSTEITTAQWLTFSEYNLLGLASGRVYQDDLGLERVLNKLSYYPREIWLWLMASQWKMLAEEEPFVGRCGFSGDDTGSRLVATRQVQRLMRLAFLMEKRYAPYSKWFGTACKELNIAPLLLPLLQKVLKAEDWAERDELLGQAYTLMAKRHNSLGLTELLETNTSDFFKRPFHVLRAERFSNALLRLIQTPELRSLPLIGAVTQFTDSVTLYDDVSLQTRLRHLYQ